MTFTTAGNNFFSVLLPPNLAYHAGVVARHRRPHGEVRVGAFENARAGVAVAATAAPSPPGRISITNTLVWVAFGLGVASAVPGMVLGLFGLPLGLGAAAVSLVALVRLTNKPPEQRRGELITLVSLGFGVFQVVFLLVAFYFVDAA